MSNDRLAIGAPYQDNSGENSGAVYLYQRSGSDWVLEVYFSPSDGSENDEFGKVVALEGNTLAVGAHQNDALGSNSGCVYVFEYANGLWSESQQLTNPEGEPGDQFGVLSPFQIR